MMLKLSCQGWILSPYETKQELLSRKQIAEKNSTSPLPADHPSHNITETLYQFRLETIEVFYSKKSILPWQGALLWSYNNEGEKPFPVIQLRKQNSPDEAEILAHELVHAARFAFKEPFFEEILAYQTSSKKLYRIFGPLFIFEKEPLIFLLGSWVVFLLATYLTSPALFGLPLIIFFALLFRLFLLQTIFSIAKKNIKKAGAPYPLAVLLRLSDKEIFLAALLPFKRIIQKNKDSIRFKSIISLFVSGKRSHLLS